MYERPPPRRRHHDEPDPDTGEFRDAIIDAIDHDPRVRDAILRLFAAQRARKKTAAQPQPRARARRRET